MGVSSSLFLQWCRSRIFPLVLSESDCSSGFFRSRVEANFRWCRSRRQTARSKKRNVMLNRGLLLLLFLGLAFVLTAEQDSLQEEEEEDPLQEEEEEEDPEEEEDYDYYDEEVEGPL